jgi:hypothetical protein
VLLWGLAAAYFYLGVGDAIECVDEGHLVYFSWRAAEGALPYRDFQHWYGPSVFFWNGLLFRLFGPDLLVVRVALLALRAALAVSVFLSTRVLAGTPAALLAYAVTVAIGGAPLWIFTTPYASSYQLPLVLGSLTAFLLMPAWPRGRLLLVGACLGLAATFKPTGGLFPLAGFVVFLLARHHRSADGAVGRAPWRGLAIAAAAGVLAALAVLGASMGDPGTVALLLLPLVLLALRALYRVRCAPDHVLARNLVDVAWLALGCTIAPAFLAAYYAAHGELTALAWSTLFGLPRMFTYFVPYPLPHRDMLPILGLAAVTLAALSPGRPAAPRSAIARSLTAGGGLVLTAALVLHSVPRTTDDWLLAALRLWSLVPPAVVWVSSLALMRATDAEPLEPIGAVTHVTSALLPLLAPVADLLHVVLMLPMFLPLTAWALHALWTRAALDAEPARHAWALVLLAAWVVAATGPLVLGRVSAELARDAPFAVYDRATGVVDRRPDAAALSEVVRYLRTHVAPGDRVLVVPSQAMIYFLSGRRSALDRDEFFFYAATAGPQLSAADARRFADEAEAIRRLETERPVLVRGKGAAAAAFRAAFPDLAEYLARSYRRVVGFGPYEILEWHAADVAR